MGEPASDNIVWSQSHVPREERCQLLRQCGCVLWFTGLSGSGKSTIARALEHRLVNDHRYAYLLDGDNVRHGLNKDLGFAPEDRSENIRRIGEVATLFADAGCICLVAFISPYRQDRIQARKTAKDLPFIEIHMATPLQVCEQRDPKGLYKKARAGKISQFTGIDAPYEEPASPNIRIHTSTSSINQSVDTIIAYLHEHGVLGAACKGVC
jgi:adenylylsulfate kinase